MSRCRASFASSARLRRKRIVQAWGAGPERGGARQWDGRQEHARTAIVAVSSSTDAVSTHFAGNWRFVGLRGVCAIIFCAIAVLMPGDAESRRRVGDLKRVISNVKSRAGWGEVQPGMLLDDMLAREQFETNVKVLAANRCEIPTRGF